VEALWRACCCGAFVVLVLAGAHPLSGNDGVELTPTTVYSLPSAGTGAVAALGQVLGPEHPLELRGLAGEIVLARIAVQSAELVKSAGLRMSPEEGPATRSWHSVVVPGRPASDTAPTYCTIVALPDNVEPGFYDAALSVHTDSQELTLPVIIAVGKARLEPAATPSLFLVSSADDEPAWSEGLPDWLPPRWPYRLPVAMEGLEKQTGELSLDLSQLDDTAQGLAPAVLARQRMPVFLAPLMKEMSRRFELRPLSAEYVLAMHSLLSVLRDWAEAAGVSLVFVPPTSADDPDSLALQQHLTVMRETPGVDILLPVEPVLQFRPAYRRWVLSFARAYLAGTADGVKLARKAGDKELPTWLLVDGGRRAEAGLGADLAGVDVILVTADNMDSYMTGISARTDARYVATLTRLAEHAKEGDNPNARRIADNALEELKRLRRDIQKAGEREDTTAAELQEKLDDMRHALRPQIELLSDVTDQP